MTLNFTTVDAFTTTPYKGNPLGVIEVPASTSLSQKQKQLIAKEFNLSEVVFLHEQTEADRRAGDARIDIFTPIAEVPFAGHPTVGVSNFLLRFSRGSSSSYRDVMALQAKAGRIPIELAGDDTIQLRVAHDVHIHNEPFKGRTFAHHPVVSIVKGMTFILARMSSLEDLAVPTSNLLGTENTYKSQDALDGGWRVGLITSYFFVDLGVDEDGVRQLRTRMLGSREDPATGSAASALTSYLTLTEQGAAARKYQVTQGVEMGRKSDISVTITLTEDGQGVKEVLLAGSAVKVMEGRVNIPQDS